MDPKNLVSLAFSIKLTFGSGSYPSTTKNLVAKCLTFFATKLANNR